MIPHAITRAHVLEALEELNTRPVPAHRQSVDYDLLYDGKRYPPKYVVSLATKHATGAELAPDAFSSGPETNEFLHGLGFDVVKRTRAVVTGPEADVPNVRLTFERLVPDEPTRRVIAEIFATTIERANAAGSQRWEITFQSDLVRLNGGRVLMFDVTAHDAFVALDASLLGAETLARIEAVGRRYDPYFDLPQFVLYRLPHAELVALWSSIEPAFRSFAAEAVLTARRCVWLRFHAPAAVEYLSEVVGRTLPQPDTAGSNDDLANERGIFWVNQGKTFDAERAAGQLFARQKAADGSAPAHWARLERLTPGDVVVHYVSGEIRALSRVRSTAAFAARSGSAGSEQGLLAEVEYWTLPSPVDIETVFADADARSVACPDPERGPFERKGKVKQGYLWDFTEEGLALINAASADRESWPPWTKRIRPRTWMFHANPQIYDIRAAVRELPEMNYRVQQHRSEIRIGDTVFLWESGADAAIVAVASVLTEPAVMRSTNEDAKFMRAGFEEDDSVPVVRLAIDRVLDPPIEADDMRADPTLATLQVFTSPQRSNSVVGPAQAALLRAWIDGKRPPRIVKIAPGDRAELWSECLANGYVCVGWDEIGDLRQFPTWSAFRRAFGASCELGKIKGHVTNKALELWTLTRLRPGDKVVANRGISQVLGVGTVKEPGYVWDERRSRYKHTVLVDWDTTRAGEIPPHKHWGVTTVGKVPSNVVALVLPELADAAGVGPEASAEVSRAGLQSKGGPAAKKASMPPPVPPFAALVRSLQSKEARLWFDDEVVAHYVLALQAKRFVILTGVSGTGKTQLALAVAKHFQPKTRRTKHVPPPDGAVAKRVSPYMGKSRSLVLPIAVGAELRLGGMQGTGSTSIDVEYPGGDAELSLYREVRTTANSVYYLSLKGEVGEWMRSLAIGSEIFFEVLDRKTSDRDRLRITVPVHEEEVVALPNYEVVAVRPDWTDSRGLLGFFNPLTGRYHTTAFLRLLLKAQEETERAIAEKRPPSPFFVILDEMNLARVEQYFADFLSSLESREALVLHDDVRLEQGEVEGDDDDELVAIPRRLAIPPNLYFTGTVNVDETTYMFSPKVLDRAFVIEFNDVNLRGYGIEGDDAESPCALRLTTWQGFDGFRGVTSEDWDALASVDELDVRASLSTLHDILANDNRHFGYRVANEIGRFITLARRQCENPKQGVRDALDLAIVSKVLPKLHGTQQELEDVLGALFAYSVGSERPTKVESWAPREGVLARKDVDDSDDEPQLPRSSLKLWRMLRRLRAQGFTSFIE